MGRKYWLIFGAIQSIGITAIFEARWFQDGILLLLSVGLLLPGSLVWAGVNWGHARANLPLWALGAISIPSNLFLFTIASFLLATYRASK